MLRSGRLCQNCNSYQDVEHDESLGHVVCTGCGGVFEEDLMVSEVQFINTSKGNSIAEGFNIQNNQAKAVSRTNNQTRIHLGNQESREFALLNGHRRIKDVANQPQIRMNDHQVEQAQRYFNLAVANNYIKGRRLNSIVAACLYIICRTEKTAHMLIDFSEALSINVYQLGATFLKLCQLLHLELPLVDPSLYISRFANMLDFGLKTRMVIRDANRLVQRMNRDWLQLGRRPAGICAACLFIAARMHGFKRTHQEIVFIVKICETTLRKRLQEFQTTPSAKLTVDEFQNIWLEEYQNPPSFDKKTKKRRCRTMLDEFNDYVVGDISCEEDGLKEYEKSVMDEMNDILSNPKNKEFIPQYLDGVDNAEDEKLSDLDDDNEIEDITNVTKEEVELKEIIWTEENKSWILKQEQKEILAKNNTRQKKTYTKKVKKEKQIFPPARTPAEATRNLMSSRPRISKKINYDVIDTLFSFDEKFHVKSEKV